MKRWEPHMKWLARLLGKQFCESLRMSAEFEQVLKKHFRWNRGVADNMPIMLTPRLGRGRGRSAIAAMMNDLGFKRGVEIGTRYGQSARIWCAAIPKLDLTCIDPYCAYHTRDAESQEKVYQDAVDNLSPLGVELIRATSESAIYRFEDGSLDFVNIDGDHSFDVAAIDIIKYVPKVRKGGLVLIHDYCAFQNAGVIPAVDAYTRCHRIDPWYVTREKEPTAFWMRGVERA